MTTTHAENRPKDMTTKHAENRPIVMTTNTLKTERCILPQTC